MSIDNKSKKVDTTLFITDLIKLGGVYDVDDEGYVVSKADPDDYIYMKVGGTSKRVMVLKQCITDNDAAIINPLNENLSESDDGKWLYATLAVGLARRFIEVAKFLNVVLAFDQSDQKDVVPAYMTPEVLEFASRHKEFDAKVYEQFGRITKNKINFMNVWYNRKLKEARFRCMVYDQDAMDAFPQVSKKAWKIITWFVSDILDLGTDAVKASEELRTKYSATSDLITVPKLQTMLRVYVNIYQKLNKYLAMCEMDDDDFVVDLSSISYHLEHIDDYYQNVKWFATTSTDVAPRPALRTLQVNPPGNIPSNPAIAQQLGGYAEQRSGIPLNPARHGIEYANTNVGFQPQGYQQPMLVQPNIGFGMNTGFNSPLQFGHVNSQFPMVIPVR